jgi:hypothetical protein
MGGFVLGVVSSLVAGLLMVAAGWITSKRMRHWPLAILSTMTGLGIRRSYRRQSLANLGLGADLAQARWVKVLAGRGNELTRDSFRPLWQETGSHLESIQILLPNPEAGTGSYLADREAEIRRYDSGYQPGLLAQQIESNIQYISTIAQSRPNVELRLYNLPNICRLIVTDQVAYLTTYSASDHGRNAPCAVYRHPGSMYEFASHMFSVAWRQATPADQCRRSANRTSEPG